MNKKLALIKKRKLITQQLLEKGFKEEDINQILTRKGYYPIEDSVKVEENTVKEIIKQDNVQDFNGKPVKKVWCHICREKITPINVEIERREVKKGSYRKFLTGVCSKCGHKVCGIVKS